MTCIWLCRCTQPDAGHVRDVLFKSDGVVHIAVEDYVYIEEDNEDEEIFDESFATSSQHQTMHLFLILR